MLGNDSIFVCHQGMGKTLSCIQAHCYWPGISKDIRSYCQSCVECQKISRKGSVRPSPIQPTFLPSCPFKKISVDLCGPLLTSKRECRFILMVMDSCTRWAEALLLRYVTTESAAEVLLSIFCRLGFPKAVLSDHGVQFVLEAMRSFTDLLSIAQTFSAIYNPRSNRLVENLNSRLLAKVTSSFSDEWDRYLPAVMFAYQKVPQHNSSFQ